MSVLIFYLDPICLSYPYEQEDLSYQGSFHEVISQ